MQESDDEKIESAINWLLKSGIQKGAGEVDVDGVPLEGGFSAWFDSKKDSYSYIYPEISGYALTTLLYLHEETGSEEALNLAKKTGDWFLKIQHDNGSFPTALYVEQGEKQKPAEYHTFDIGMIFNGMANLARVTQNKAYLDSATKAADFVMGYQGEDGAIAAQISQTDLSVKDNDKTWSTQSGAFHAKLAIGLLNIYDQNSNEKYKKSAEKLCDYALTFQQEDGQFHTYGSLKGTNLHPHAYAAEGMYVAGSYLDRDDYLESSESATRWAMENSKDGIPPRLRHEQEQNHNERVDALSQIYRLTILFPDSCEDDVRQLLKQRITKYQSTDDYPERRGGFTFGKLSDGTPADHVNCWVTQFALQALMLESRKKFNNLFYLV